MSVKDRQLFQIDKRILSLKAAEKNALPGLPFRVARAKTWAFMLYYEFVKNDLTIRAESLSYFTLFSLMPLIAGIFFIFSLFAEWAPVQKEFESLIENFLQAIPDAQRDTLVDFIYSFKDEYLAKLAAQGSIIGIFALGVLVWIAGKVFYNLESLINRIWGVNHDRKVFERVQNFVFCIVIFPIAYIAALSLPRLIETFGQKKLGFILHSALPLIIFFFSLTFILRYFPNTKVMWRSAYVGATVSTACFGISNFFLGFYFKVGTSTAYGKAAILPIFAFFIYVAWLIFILGIEVSLLCQSEERFEVQRFPKTTLSQALLLETILQSLQKRFREGRSAITARELSSEFNVTHSDVEVAVRFLRRKKIVAQVVGTHPADGAPLMLARELNENDLIVLIKDFLDLAGISQKFDVNKLLSRINSIQAK